MFALDQITCSIFTVDLTVCCSEKKNIHLNELASALPTKGKHEGVHGFSLKVLVYIFNGHQISAVRWAAFNILWEKASSVWYRLERRKTSSVYGTLSYNIPRLHSCSTSREAGEFKQHKFVLLTLIQTVLTITSSNSPFRFVLMLYLIPQWKSGCGYIVLVWNVICRAFKKMLERYFAMHHVHVTFL